MHWELLTREPHAIQIHLATVLPAFFLDNWLLFPSGAWPSVFLSGDDHGGGDIHLRPSAWVRELDLHLCSDDVCWRSPMRFGESVARTSIGIE